MQESTSVSLTARIDDYDEICRVVQLYIDGVAKEDVSKPKEAFHGDARMFGSFLRTRYDVPIAELFRMSAIAHRLCRVLWKILHEGGFDLSSKAANLIPRLRSNAPGSWRERFASSGITSPSAA